MSWGTELWDQYDHVALHTQKGIDFCDKYTHFLNERCKIELEYAKQLKRLVKQHLPKKKDEEEYQFTWSRGFWDMLKELHDLAGQHEVIAENTQGTVLKDLQQLIIDLKTDRRKGLQDGSKTQETLKVSLQQLEKSRRQYEKAFKEAEKATDAYRKADADINLSRAEVEKYRNQMMIKNQQSDESKNEYASQLQQTNQSQRDHYNTSMPQVFEQFQTTDENRINRLQDFIRQCSNIERNVIPIINTCIDGMVKAADSINAAEDSKTVVDKYKSGFPIPQDIPFDDLSGCNTAESNSNHLTPKNYINPDRNTVKGNTLSSKGKKRGGIFGIFASSKTSINRSKSMKSDKREGEEQKEDFSDLPPSQRRKQLLKKIDYIKKDVARETAEREGMLKMKEVYVQNPALGDPNSLDKKIEENAQKLDNLNQELRKFQIPFAEQTFELVCKYSDEQWKQSDEKNYLAEADGKQRRSSLSDDSISHSTSEGSVQNSSQVSAPGTPQVQHDVYTSIPDDEIQQEDDEENEFEDGEEGFPVIGTCRALYAFEAAAVEEAAVNEGSVAMEEGEEMYVLEQDQGDGWTRVRKNDNSEGFVPTSYIQCHFYDQDEV